MKYIIFFPFLYLLASCQKPQEFNVHVAWPKDNFHTIGLFKFAEKLDQKTEGKIKLNVYPEGKLGLNDESVLDVVSAGTVPIAEVLMGNVVKKAALFGLSSIPRMAGSYDHAWSLYQANKVFYQAQLEKMGIKLLYISPWPPSGLFTKNKIKKSDDFKNLRIRTYDGNSADFVKNFGAKGFAISFGKLSEALISGMIDSVLTSAVTGSDTQIWKYCKVFTEVNYAFPLNMVVMNSKVFESLSSSAKEAFLRTAIEIEQFQWKESRSSNEKAINILKSNNVEVISVFDEKIEDFLNEAARKIRDRWIINLEKGSFSLDIYNESD